MDPNAEGGPPKVEIAEVDIEVAPERPADIPSVPPTPAAVPDAAPATSEKPQIDVYHVDADLKNRLKATTPVINAPLAASIFRDAREPGWDRPVQDVDPEQVRIFQEEEFQRRLRGEYESAQSRIGDVVNDNMSRPLRLSAIRLSPPPPTTRTGFLDHLLQPFMGRALPTWLEWLHPAPPAPQNLHEILLSTKALIQHIDQLGVYDMERVGVRLESGTNPDEVELLLALREKGKLFLKAGTEFGGNEGGGNVTARIRNALGGGEAFEVNASLGTKTKSAYSASLGIPVLASPYLNLQLSAFSMDRDNTAFASHREQSQGARVKLSGITPWGVHDIGYEYIQRDINHLTPQASASIRALANTSTKAAISHTFTSDTRDDPWCGSSGRLFKATHEYAGLPGSSELAHFLKSTTQSQASRPLFNSRSAFVSVSSYTSILYPLWAPGFNADGSRKSTYLPDRTFLGGPNSVRGWKVGGLGLSDRVDSLGGELAYGLGASLLLPVPNKEHWPLKIHSFVNAGKVVRYDTDRTFADNITKLYSNPSLSVGLGIMYRLDPLRVEINFSMPLIARKGERLARGLSVGVGIEFL